MILLFIFIFGIVMGSFLNVCIYRLPLNMSIVWPPSHCMQCKQRLSWHDMIPILSYLWLKGKCRYCGASYAARYALVELLTGLLFVWCFITVGLSAELIKVFILTAFLIVITFIDYDHQLILDKVLVWFAIAGVIINLLLPDVGLLDMLLGALSGGGLLLLIAVISRGGMGGGDIKFAAALGLWVGWQLTLLCLFLAFLIGGVSGILVIILHIKGRKDYIPFGPFIAAGLFISILYGSDITSWYLAQVL
ncbi:MAG: prepilin peptidase [Pelosinus sp.]|nr:prepilin peptidase [Pelosinus sp.]